MKILIATDMNIEFVCGSTYAFKRIGSLLKERGHDMAFICPGRRTTYQKHIYEGFEIWGVESFPSLVQKTLRFSIPFMVGRSVKKALTEYKPDIVHIQSHGPLPATVIRVALTMNIPVVGTNHFVPENIILTLRPPKFLHSFLRKAAWKHLHAVFKKINHITVPTFTAAKILKESGFPKTVSTISNGIDLSKFNQNNSGDYLYERYHIPHKPILLFVGRLDPEKNIDVFIKALPDILDKVDAHSVIVGMGNRTATLKNMAIERGLDKYITFTGFLPEEDLPNIYHLASCFVMPGNAELQSIATMEAMASGLPVVAANAMALPELVHDGENGYLFPAGDSPALARKVIPIISDKKLRERMSKKSLEIIKTHDINKIIEEYESLYQKNLNR